MYFLKALDWKHVLGAKAFILIPLIVMMYKFDSIANDNKGAVYRLYLIGTFTHMFMYVVGILLSPRWMTKQAYDVRNTCCSICIERVDSEKAGKILVGECGHVFHSNCISAWLTRKKSCPLCRKKVKVWDRLHSLDNMSILFVQSRWPFTAFESNRET
jgi:hypothetical protein